MTDEMCMRLVEAIKHAEGLPETAEVANGVLGPFREVDGTEAFADERAYGATLHYAKGGNLEGDMETRIIFTGDGRYIIVDPLVAHSDFGAFEVKRVSLEGTSDG